MPGLRTLDFGSKQHRKSVMSEGREKDTDLLSGENWLTDWERQVVDDWQDGSDVEERTQQETELAAQKIYAAFQNSATAITHLYKAKDHRLPSPSGKMLLHGEEALEFSGFVSIRSAQSNLA